MPAQPFREQAWTYAIALLLVVAAGFLVRLALTPVFHSNHTYTAFYSVVIIAAYFLGRGRLSRWPSPRRPWPIGASPSRIFTGRPA
jgi:hypothetical protein